jgi:signal peptidase I
MEKKSIFKEYIEPIIIAVLIALFVRSFIVQAFKIPSSSMEPTLLVGDYLLVNKFLYGIRIPFTDKKVLSFKKPQRGDIIVFIYPKDRSKDFIKRVIGQEGEKVSIVQNKIYINDQLVEDPWGHFSDKNVWSRYLPSIEGFGPVVVPKDSLFVLGDNRDNSEDSRTWGFVEKGNLKGKVSLVLFSWAPDPNAPKLRSPYVLPLIEIFFYNLYHIRDRVRWSRIVTGVK